MPCVKSDLCQVKELNLTCFGCCGYDFTGKSQIMKDIKKNTLEYKQIRNKEKFRDRADKDSLRKSGLCRNLVVLNNKVLCPLHPGMNKGKELRKGHCDINYICKTSKLYTNEWDEETRKQFIEFLKTKKLDTYTYSLGMDKGLLLKEFMKWKKQH